MFIYFEEIYIYLKPDLIWTVPSKMVRQGTVSLFCPLLLSTTLPQCESDAASTYAKPCRINLALSDVDYSGHLALCRSPADGTPGNYPCDPRKPDDFFAYENDPACGSDYEDMIGQRNYTTSSGASSAGHEATLYKFKSIRPGR